jgi:hypothetical protein
VEKIGETKITAHKLTSTDLFRDFLSRLSTRLTLSNWPGDKLTFLVWTLVVVIALANLLLFVRGDEGTTTPASAPTTGQAIMLPALTDSENSSFPLSLLLDFSYAVVDAEYSLAQDRLVMVSQEPQALHIYDPNSGNETTISLSHAPLAVAVSPNGQFAAVGHDKFVSYLNLQQEIVLRAC